jgi:Zn-dependent protease
VEELVQRLIAVALILLFAAPVHEFSHAYIAFRLGDSTARWQGRLTLNPIVHFDPVGGTLLALSAVVGGFFIGWAKPTPVNVYNLRGGRRAEALVALAGPLSNLVLAIIVAIPLRIILASPDMVITLLTDDRLYFVVGIVEYFMVINIVLMIFNLLPIPPLDGWHTLLAVVNPRLSYTLRQYQQYGFVIVLLLILSGAAFLGPLVDGIERLLLGI